MADVVAGSKFAEDFSSERVSQPEEPAGEASHRHSTLKKKNSLKHSGPGSPRRGSVASGISNRENLSSPYYSPIPTQGSPTDTLVNRFQAWRRVLRDFIVYFKEVQAQQEVQSKSALKLSQTLNSTSQPEEFMKSGGLLESNAFLRSFHKEAYLVSENARSAEGEIINHLNGLRGDLTLKIKEIKALSGDFKNSVDKEKEVTRKAILQLADSLTAHETNPHSAAGKNEPYLVKLYLEKQLRRQLSEENYLHKAYKNLENSGRELESIVVEEIQKAFESYIKIIRQNGTFTNESASKLEQLALQLPHDREWSDFVQRDPTFAGVGIPLRSVEDIEYPGFKHPATVEIRAGPLERRSKYLRSYTAGWYVLSSTHLHEFKFPDRVNDPSPVMSLYLPDCRVGSHAAPGAKSHKFILWGRQVGPMHTRHKWTFRAESHETMLQWFEDIKKLIELSSEERNAYIAAHQQPLSAEEGDIGDEEGDSLENDEADDIPYSSSAYTVDTLQKLLQPKRPEGGRFPSDIQLDRGLAESQRPRSSGSDYQSRNHSRSSSAFSYDETHPYSKALEGEKEEVVPVMADVSPDLERHLSIRHNYEENGELLKQRRDSTTRKPPSRKPTASYGIDPLTGQPDPAVQPQLGNQPLDWSQLAHENGTGTRTPGVSRRKPPSRQPTSSYGFDPVTGLPDESANWNDSANQLSAVPVTLSPAGSTETESSNTARGVPSISSLRDLHVPGKYPKPSDNTS